jgi:transcriptional regulator with XRE-family HTH domain
MYLAEYLQETGMSQAEFARRAGISGPTVASVLVGKDVKLSVAVLIEIATKGKVKCKECTNMDYIRKKRLMAKK